jgi:hypothetical protein
MKNPKPPRGRDGYPNIDDATDAADGLAETPDKTGGVPFPRSKDDTFDPDATEEEMRNQDS